MAQNVQFLLNNTLAGQIAKNLDTKDGNADGKIRASIWNEFVKDKCGNTISNFISTETAMNSITTYVVKLAKNMSITADTLAKTWLDGIGTVVPQEVEEVVEPENAVETETQQPEIPQVDAPENIPAKDENPPKAVENPPEADENVPECLSGLVTSKINRKNNQLKNLAVKNLDGTIDEYDENGYIVKQYDANGNRTREIERVSDGTVERYWDNEYDANGNRTRTIWRSSDGTVDSYWDYEYDANGNNTREISRNSDGTVYRYYDYEYDANGNKTRKISRYSDGTVYRYYDYEYDANGNNTREIWRNPDGTVHSYYDYEYDANGNRTREIWRDPDGAFC